MRKLKRSECAVLTLVLKGKWYDMIASGKKLEEYRGWKPYWVKRINKWCNSPGVMVVAFSRGYRRADMFFMAHVLNHGLLYKREYPHPEWGEPNDLHYVIILEERVELED